MDQFKTIDVFNLKRMLSERDNFVLLDVREPEEFEICHIDGSILVPFSEIDDHLQDLDLSRQYVVYCKEGDRSLKAINLMSQFGFQNLYNLDGGVIKWASKLLNLQWNSIKLNLIKGVI